MSSDLPLILAGPILRRVAKSEICVWIATSQNVRISMDIFQKDDKTSIRNESQKYDIMEKNLENSNMHRKGLLKIGSGTNKFVEMGAQLFVNLIVAKPFPKSESPYYSELSPSYPLDELLAYDLYFQIDNDGVPKLYNLKDMGLTLGDNSIVYQTMNKNLGSQSLNPLTLDRMPFPYNIELPTFFIPSINGNSVTNFLYGSCRKLHGEDEDSLVVADTIMSESFDDLIKRPRALFLIGDQIYADNVAGPLISFITNLSRKIMGWDEKINGLESRLGDIRPGERVSIVKELTHFSSDDVGNHLLGLGEFAAMYLIAWNAQIWPSELDQMPSNGTYDYAEIEKYQIEKMHLYQSRNNLKKIRRLLANVPTYMICDDHEITDDWNINREWYREVCNSKSGKQIITNGLVAYWAFQAWGNDPDAFDDDFKKFIKSYIQLKGELSLQYFQDNRTSLIVDKDNLTANESLVSKINLSQDQILNTKKWTFVAPTYPLTLFLDCRTQRKFVDEHGPPILLSGEALSLAKNKLLKAGYQTGNPLIIVSPTPVLGFELAESVQRFLTIISGSYKWDLETWRANEDGFVRFLYFILTELHPDYCVFLSGDVHYAFTMKGDLIIPDLLSHLDLLDQAKTEPESREFKISCHARGIQKQKDRTRINNLSAKLQMLQLTSSPFKSDNVENRQIAILVLNLFHLLVIATRRATINGCKFDYKRIYQWHGDKFVQTSELNRNSSNYMKKPEYKFQPKYFSEHNSSHSLFSKFFVILNNLKTRYLKRRISDPLPFVSQITEFRLLKTSNSLFSSPVLSKNNMGQVSLDYKKKIVVHKLLYFSDGLVKSKQIVTKFR